MGKFTKGHTPWNKGIKGFNPSPETQFKPGQYIGEKHPHWNGGVQRPKRDCVHLYKGVGERARRPVEVYRQHYGEIPDGYVIRHVDGNPYNDAPENLIAVSRAQNLKLNRINRKT